MKEESGHTSLRKMAPPLRYIRGEINKLIRFDGDRQEERGESRPAATAAADEAGECFM